MKSVLQTGKGKPERGIASGGLMADRRADVISGLEKGLENSIVFFKSLPPEKLGLTVYQDGAAWTVQQVLAHFITIERSMQWLFNNMLSGGPGSPGDFDLERFNRTQPQKLDGLALNELIDQFRSVRRDTIAIVKGMSENDLDREGLHPFHGHGTLERFIRWAYEHVGLHENDIRTALNIAKKRLDAVESDP
jgi:hypothetical protein